MTQPANPPAMFCPINSALAMSVTSSDFVAYYTSAVPRGTETGLWVWAICANGADAVTEVRLRCD